MLVRDLAGSTNWIAEGAVHFAELGWREVEVAAPDGQTTLVRRMTESRAISASSSSSRDATRLVSR